MPKAYLLSVYRTITDPDKVAAYGKLAGPAIEAAGGRFLARGIAAKAMEAGTIQRTVVVEFDTLDQALALYDSPTYREALAALDGGAERDIRIIEGVP